MEEDEHIVMTPRKKEAGSTTIMMERVKKPTIENSGSMHIAGGAHKGIVINKQASNDTDKIPSQIKLEFKVFLISNSKNTHTQESRQLRFWFKPDVEENERMISAQDFFKELVSPSEFPRDYVGFIKKIMKMMQLNYPMIGKTELEMRQIQEMGTPPKRPTNRYSVLYEVSANGFKQVSVDDSLMNEKIELTPEKILDVIESSYPNPISVSDMANTLHSSDEDVYFYLQELTAKGVVKRMDSGNYTRVTRDDTAVKIVKQMPTVLSSHQPTIAIITAQYCEKLAVDAMIENKDTYVRYKTEGESNVYTLGNIGAHRVVATKLPTVGHSRAAIIASGNTTTRLLGSFQKVDYVFLVGVGGGIPHYTDYNRHVRLGDVVISTTPSCEGFGNPDQKYVYMYSERIKNSPDSPSQYNGDESTVSYSYNVKTWCPPEFQLQEIAQQLHLQGLDNPNLRPWEKYIREVQQSGANDGNEKTFVKPKLDTDKLYMSIGGKDVIEVAHPTVPANQVDMRSNGMPAVHFGAIGSGRSVIKDETIRQEFAHRYGIKAYDTEFDTVVESIFGNRKDNYVLIRGVADYRDGTRNKEWQSFAALTAAAFMKAIICAMEAPYDD